MALSSSAKQRSRCCLNILFFFFLNASPSSGNMQNANVRLVKAVTPSSSAGSLQHRHGEGSFPRREISSFRGTNCKMPRAEQLTKIQQQEQYLVSAVFPLPIATHKRKCPVWLWQLPFLYSKVPAPLETTQLPMTSLIQHADTHRDVPRRHSETLPGCHLWEAVGWH